MITEWWATSDRVQSEIPTAPLHKPANSLTVVSFYWHIYSLSPTAVGMIQTNCTVIQFSQQFTKAHTMWITLTKIRCQCTTHANKKWWEIHKKTSKTKNATRETFYLFYLTICFITYHPTDGDTLLLQQLLDKNIPAWWWQVLPKMLHGFVTYITTTYCYIWWTHSQISKDILLYLSK